MLSRRPAVLAVAACAALALTACHSSGPRPPGDVSCLPCGKILHDPGDSTAVALCPIPPGPPALGKGPFPRLVFEGGGVKGIAYAGSLAVMEEAELMRHVDEVAGTSAGSITALAVALGYSADEVQRILLDLDFRRFEDGRFPFTVVRLFEEYGLYPGDYALCFLRCLVEVKTGDPETTFGELHELAEGDSAFRDLHVVSTDVDTHRAVFFSHASHPDLALAHAARMSMSIPYFFAAQSLDGDVFVDGGVVDNYPLDVFAEAPADSVLGFHLGTAPARGEPIGDLVTYTKELFTTLLDVQVDAFCRRPADVRRSVVIDPLGIGTTDFAITREQKCALVASGAKAAHAWLAEEEPSGCCPVWLTELLPSPRAELCPP